MYVNLKCDGKEYLYERLNDYIRNTFHDKITKTPTCTLLQVGVFLLWVINMVIHNICLYD